MSSADLNAVETVETADTAATAATAKAVKNVDAESLESVDLDDAFAQAHAVEQAFVRQALLDAAREAIWMVDVHGNIIVENATSRNLYLELTGEETTSLAERMESLLQTVAEPDAFRAATQDLLDDFDREQVLEWKHSQSGRSFNRYSLPVRNQSGAAIGRLFVVREVTLEKENERLKDEFIALVSHELRTPLTSMIGFLDLIQDPESGPLNEEQTHFVKTLDRNTKRLLRIVGDLLFVAQSDAGRISLSPFPQQLDELVAYYVEEVGPAAESRELELSFSVEAHPRVNADQERLGQVVNNLLSNALKFTEPGGHVAVRVYVDGQSACVSIADDGMGMSEEDQAKLFQRFFRTDKATELAIQGTGLGLAICKTIIERHGGEISVQSEEGVGSTFLVKLPLLDDDD